MKSVEVTASNRDAALKDALSQLGANLNQVEIVDEKTSGLIRKKTTMTVQFISAEDLALGFVNGIISNMGVDAKASLTDEDGSILINIEGPDASKLIGYHGDMLDSLQYLTLLVANKNNPENKRLIIDGENYREKRTATLSKLAKRLAIKAAKSGENVSLEPMNPFERRIIHSSLADDSFVTTTSEGEDPNRYVVIVPNKKRQHREYNKDRKPRYNKYNDKKPAAPAKKEEEEKDMYNQEYSRQFKKTGARKMKTYGAPKSHLF